MIPALLQVGLTFVVSLIVAITTALLTVRLALRRFYQERLWEAKMRAYTDIIQAVHHMKRDLDITLDALAEGREAVPDSEFHRAWDEKHRAAWDEVRKQIDVGDFLYSPASVQILESLSDESSSDPNDMYEEHLERMQKAVNRCLPAIKAAARKDLGLPTVKRALREAKNAQKG